jgi:tetratricopeptide (TPR) repeat protein
LSLSVQAACEQASSLLQARESPAQGNPEVVRADDARAVAWALKELCYEAFGSEPRRAALAANALRLLSSGDVPPAHVVEVVALARWAEGIACVTRGQMAAAVACFDAAATGLRDAGLPDPAAQTQVPKIMALSMLGQHDEAAACAEAAQRELLALGNVRIASRVSQNLGALHFRRDDYVAAARHYREAAVLFARVGDHLNSVRADIGLADASTAMGDFDEALRIFARARMRAGHRGMDLQLAQLDESVALLDQARGRYPQALAGFETARRRYEALGVPQYLAIAEKQLADAYLELRLLPEARAMFEAAVTTFASLDMPDEQAWALAQRGRTEALLGQGGADASFAASADLFAAQDNAVGTATVSLARAELALADGSAARALQEAERAASGFGAAGQASGLSRAVVVGANALLGLDRPDEARRALVAEFERARSRQQQGIEVQCLSGLGLAAKALGDATGASALFEAAIERFEEQRRALPGDDLRSAFLSDHLRPYQEQLRAALVGGTGAEVLWQLDRFRARSLDEGLSDERLSELDENTQALRERLDWLYRRVQRLHDEGGASAVLETEVRDTERILLEAARRGRLQGPLRASVAHGEFSVAQLQEALEAGDTLVEYGVMDGELFACVARRADVVLVRRIARWADVLEAIGAFSFQLEALNHGAAPMQRHIALLTARAEARAARLHALVWAPLADSIAACERVLVVPHAQLGAVPFAALQDGGLPLGQQHQLAVAPSARIALRGIARRPAAAHRVLALGESSTLPHAAREAMAVAARFEAGAAFVGEAATWQTLRSEAPGADVLHLACHARFRVDNPRFSALLLHDGAVTVERIEALRLRPATVVLSACETALAETATGDERVGLVRAFIVAGASRVVASLWPVDDDITAGFMSRFYARLAAGDNPAAALRVAQRLTALDHPHPSQWAAHTLYGGW